MLQPGNKTHGILPALTLSSWCFFSSRKFGALVVHDVGLPETFHDTNLPNFNGHAHHLAPKIGALCKDGLLQEALYLTTNAHRQGILVPCDSFASLFRCCGNSKAAGVGRLVHELLVSHGMESSLLLGNLLLSMYIKCESMVDAIQWFNKMLARDVFTWTLLITALIKSGKYEEALSMFCTMEHAGVKPSMVTFLTIFKACMCARDIMIFHAYSIQHGVDCEDFVCSTLLDVYAKCGRVDDAYALFKNARNHDVVPWNAMIAGYAQLELHDQAFASLGEMIVKSVEPDMVTYLNLLKSCVGGHSLQDGQIVHAAVVQYCLDSNISIENSLMDMYVKCMSMADAQYVFDNMSERDVVSWSVMISGYTQSANANGALHLFELMHCRGIQPNRITYMTVLKACATVRFLRKGRLIHMDIILNNYEQHPFVGSALIFMYSKCFSIEDALLVFQSLPKRDTVTWNAMIDGYSETREDNEALKFFWCMMRDGVAPDEASFVSSVKACSSVADLKQGRWVHSCAVEFSIHSHAQVGNILVEMYAKCSCMTDARHVFDRMLDRPMFTWTAAIAGYVQNGLNAEGLQLFDQMKQEGVVPSEVTFSAVSKACASPLSCHDGKQLHVPIIELNFGWSAHVGNSLLDMYSKSGNITYARQVFDKMPQRDAVSFNTIISGFVHNGICDKAMDVFRQMMDEDVRADAITLALVTKACASLAILEEGMLLHALAIEGGEDTIDDVLRSMLLDMYIKCGSLPNATRVFDGILRPDTLSWTAMVSGYAQHGCGQEAIHLLERMEEFEEEVDEVTFVCVLSACSYAGLVEEGLFCLSKVHGDHGILPSSQHFACVIDLLGRAGRLFCASVLIREVPCQPAVVVWTALLGACKLHEDLGLANYSMECILELEPGNVAAPVLLSNAKVVFQEQPKLSFWLA